MSYKLEHQGKSVTLPDFKEMPVGVIRKARKLAADEQMWFILEEILDEKQLEILDSMSLEEFTKSMNEWTQGAPLGESLKSSS
jgi:hypothetical protein